MVDIYYVEGFLSLHTIFTFPQKKIYFKDYKLPHAFDSLLVVWSDQIIW